MAGRKARPRSQQNEDPEAIALRIHQIAATAGALAEVAAQLDDHGQPLSHALNLIEQTLLEVEERVERLRPIPP
jgi:hypothetical protein